MPAGPRGSNPVSASCAPASSPWTSRWTNVGVVVTTVVGAAVVAAIVVVVGCWKVTGIDASVTPWAWTVTWVVPNGRSKLSVVVWSGQHCHRRRRHRARCR